MSCNGNILINVGPTRFGTIDPIFADRLRDLGHWLRINGEAIYDSVPWLHQKDIQTSNVWYTSGRNDKSGRETVYAIILDYPYETAGIDLYSLRNINDLNTEVELLGFPGRLKVINQR